MRADMVELAGWRPFPAVATSGVRGFGGAGPGDRGTSLIAENPMWVEATIAMDAVTWTHVGIRYEGKSTLLSAWNAGSLKLPLEFDVDEFEDDRPEITYPRFYGVKRLSLSNAVADPSFLRDATAYDLLAAAGLAKGMREGIEAAFQKENHDDEPSWADVEAVHDALHAPTRTTDPAAGAPPGGPGGPRGGAAGRPGGAPRSASLDRADVDAGWPVIRLLLDDPVYAAADAFVSGRSD